MSIDLNLGFDRTNSLWSQRIHVHPEDHVLGVGGILANRIEALAKA